LKRNGGVVWCGISRDSRINGLCVESLFEGVNFGVSGETLMNSKVEHIKNLDHKIVILSYGVNDLPLENGKLISRYEEIVNAIPKSTKIYILSVFPIDEDVYHRKINPNILSFNSALATFCEGSRATFIDSSSDLIDEAGQLSSDFHRGDGIHLNQTGNKIWGECIKSLIAGVHH